MTNTMNLDRWAVKAVNPDFTTRNGFRWAFPGEWTTDPADTGNGYTKAVCPSRPGDGLSVAKTVRGMASGGYVPRTVLVVGFDDGHVLAEDSEKVKVSAAFTLEVVDGLRWLRDWGRNANLAGANLYGANLYGADLTRAYLYGHDKDDLKARGAIL